jgi:hypothetical protein
MPFCLHHVRNDDLCISVSFDKEYYEICNVMDLYLFFKFCTKYGETATWHTKTEFEDKIFTYRKVLLAAPFEDDWISVKEDGHLLTLHTEESVVLFHNKICEAKEWWVMKLQQKLGSPMANGR